MESPAVSLIIPIYNEKLHLTDFLDYIDSVDIGYDHELVFIDDCSTDGSAEIVQEYKFKKKHQLIRQATNQGKGAAVRRGFEVAQGKVIGVQDADFEYRAEDINKLVKPILEGECDVAFGTRFARGGIQVHRTYHYLVNRVLTLLSNMMSGLYLSDMETCYKFFRAEIIKNVELTSDRFGFEPEITAKVARLRTKVVELPISYFPRNYMEGKKITWKDGVAALYHILSFNLQCRKGAPVRPGLPKKYIPQGAQWL